MGKGSTSTCAEEYKLLVMAMMLMAQGKIESITTESNGYVGSAVIRLSHLPATSRSGSSES
jgi:hypothetical protein